MSSKVPLDDGWGEGLLDEETRKLAEKYLRPDELDLAKRVHLETNWPQVDVQLKAIGRKKDRHLGLQAQMVNYREHVSYLLCRLILAREEVQLKEET